MTLPDVHVCLYLAVPGATEGKLVPASAGQRLRRRLARAMDVMGWFAMKRTSVRYYSWYERANTNKGDSAIREAIKEQLSNAFAPRPVTFSELQWGALNGDVIQTLNRSCDLFVLGGSGYFHLDRAGRIAQRVTDDLPLLAQLTCAKTGYGIGCNSYIYDGAHPLPDPAALPGETLTQVRAVTAQLATMSVRDGLTRDLVKAASGEECFLTGDSALFYKGNPSPPQPRAKDPQAPLDIGLNFAIHGPNTARDMERDFLRIAAFLKAFARERPVVFHYVRHAHTERMIPLLLRAHGIGVRVHDPRPEDMIAFYRELDLHISQMLHSCILSLNAGTPVVNFAYDAKNLAFFELMGLSEFCHLSSDFDINMALASARKALDDRGLLRTRIKVRKHELSGELDRFLAATTAATGQASSSRNPSNSAAQV